MIRLARSPSISYLSDVRSADVTAIGMPPTLVDFSDSVRRPPFGCVRFGKPNGRCVTHRFDADIEDEQRTGRAGGTSVLDELRRLHRACGAPSLSTLEDHARLAGHKVSRVAMWDLLNGTRRPRLRTVEGFVAACCSVARHHRPPIRLGSDDLDLDAWRTRYVTAYKRPPGSDTSVGSTLVPRQLPPVARLAGRESDLAEINAAFKESSGSIIVITGTAGVGKTTLAVYWAHEAAADFPDGQLYVDLGGFGRNVAPLSPDEALRDFLAALDVPAERIPTTTVARSTMYRSVIASRRMIVVLDNAVDADQVRPLLSGGPGCFTIVTSRNQLGSLIAIQGARLQTLDLLTEAGARQMLRHRLGDARMAAEPEATESIIARCARLPLALAVVAARVAAHPATSLRSIAGEIMSVANGLDMLAIDDGTIADVRSVLSWSYRMLAPAAARLFRLLSVHPGPDIDVRACAHLAASTVDQTRGVLAELARAHLVSEGAGARYAMHDLLRAYSRELAGTEGVDEIRAAALRLADHYLGLAAAADHLLEPLRDRRIRLVESQPTEHGFRDADDARKWFRSERPVLTGLIESIARLGLDRHAWQLAWVSTTFLDREGHWSDWVAALTTALNSAERLDHRAAQAVAHRLLAHAAYGQDRQDEAVVHLRQALRLFRQLGDQISEAATHNSLGGIRDHQGKYRTALKHARQALRLFEMASDHLGHAHALNSVGWCYVQLGRYDLALTYCQQSQQLLARYGDKFGEAAAWDSLGFICHRLGEHDEAIDSFHRALELFRAAQDPFYESTVLIRLGDCCLDMGSVESARSAWKLAADILDRLNRPEAETIRRKRQGAKT
jgi:tetratricopeptide (TPR) repeat protein